MREKLRKIRKDQGINQNEMARYLGIGRSAFSKKENGDLKFTVEELEMYSEKLGVELALIIKL